MGARRSIASSPTIPEWQYGVMRRIRFGPGDTCWDWEGATNEDGRPVHSHAAGISRLASHHVYLIFVGPIPAGVDLHHRCLHGWCVNPWHLTPLLPDEHKGEHGGVTVPTHCPHGHVLDKRNLGLYTRPNGKMRVECKQCGRERMAQWKANQTGGKSR